MLPSVYFPHGPRNGLNWVPSKIANSGLGGGVASAKFLAPLSHALGSSLVCNSYRATAIVTLLFLCSPAAIVLAVALGIILSLAGMARGWSRSHISDEVVKIHPFRVHADSPSSVGRVGFAIRACAAFFHSSPDKVLRPHGVSTGVAVFEVFSRNHLAPDAAARSHLPVSHILLPDENSTSAACTLTDPLSLSIRRLLTAFDYRKATEFLSDQINKLVVGFHQTKGILALA